MTAKKSQCMSRGTAVVEGDLIRRLDAAEFLGLPPATLDRLVRAGVLAGVRDAAARRVYLRRDELEAYKAKLADGNADPPVRRGRYAFTAAGSARAYAPIKERLPRTSPDVPGKPTGRWKARYLGIDGKPHQLGVFEGKRAAEKATEDHVATLNRLPAPPGEGAPITIGNLVENWPFGRRVSPRTLATNRERIRRYVLPHLPDGAEAPLASITEANVMQVQHQLLDLGLAKGTIDGAIASLRALWVDAAAGGYVAKRANPAKGIYVAKTDNRLHPKKHRHHRAVAISDVTAFAVELPARWVARCLLGRFTGVRAGEFPYVNLHNVDRERQLLWVNQTSPNPGEWPAPRPGTKTDRRTADNGDPGRWVPFPTALGDWLLDLQPEPLDGYVIRAPRGGHYSLRNFYARVWSPAMDAAVKHSGIVRFDLVDLRHTFASYLHAAGVPGGRHPELDGPH